MEDWDASEIVKLKTKNVCKFNLDPEKTQHNNYASDLPYSPTIEYWNMMTTATFFENKLSVQDIDNYNSLYYRFLPRRVLEEKKTSHGPNQSPVEKHIDFLDALDFVFTHKIQLNTGKYKGKTACYEPPDETGVKNSLAAIEEIVPRQGSHGKGTDWVKRTAALVRWFHENGVITCLSKIRITVHDKKQQVWVIDDAQGKEHASMMGVKIPENERTQTFESIRKSEILYVVD